MQQQPTLDSVVALHPSARDIPFVSEHQAKQYYFVARNLINQILKISPTSERPKEQNDKQPEGDLGRIFWRLCGDLFRDRKTEKKLTRFKKLDRRAELIKDNSVAYSLLQAKIIDYITIKNSLHQLAMNHFSIIKLFPDYGLQAAPR